MVSAYPAGNRPRLPAGGCPTGAGLWGQYAAPEQDGNLLRSCKTTGFPVMQEGGI
jgi:hypothetical protein